MMEYQSTRSDALHATPAEAVLQGLAPDGGLYTMQGIPRYKYEGGVCVLRSEAEIAEDVANLPKPEPSQLEQTQAEAVQYKAALKILGIETEG